MTKQELDAFDRCIEGMTSYDRAWVLNRDVAKLVGEIRAKDALIADLLGYIERIQWTDAEAVNIEKLKARAAQ